MLRSMYSGISGMKNFQTKLDVIGNNIANVNTFGYKKGRATFKDMVSQQIAGATGPNDPGRGGTNPRQVGLGSQLATIDTIHTQGSLQNTNRALDLGISGDGYFVLSNGQAGDDAVYSYTRAGNFYLDNEGYLVNSDGMYVMGGVNDEINDAATDFPPESEADFNRFGRIRIPSNVESFSIGQDGKVVFMDGATLRTGGQLLLAKFSNNEGLAKVGDNMYQPTANSGTPQLPDGDVDFADTDPTQNGYVTFPGTNGAGSLVAGTLEMSNVDLSEEFTEMIVAQRGFQANTRIITTSDEILQELVNLKR
ncbi:flagellar basal-body rod protein FlgG [Bacillus sp. FJAT-45037]|uniref:flagellar basal-body rod protein FlgG n=1 Tax=Bacillus sp. FJAT-45037 TaxID=2011007 RepID=UPI000C24BF2E|nr:flagellar basal-body rod protein FlgG [Bacillus sp. FJAT-45037]